MHLLRQTHAIAGHTLLEALHRARPCDHRTRLRGDRFQVVASPRQQGGDPCAHSANEYHSADNAQGGSQREARQEQGCSRRDHQRRNGRPRHGNGLRRRSHAFVHLSLRLVFHLQATPRQRPAR